MVLKIQNFNDYLRSKDITNLIIGGFNQFQCVAETTEGALAHGYSVMVAGPLIYGDHYDKFQKRKSMRLYKKNCTYFHTIRGLLNSLE